MNDHNDFAALLVQQVPFSLVLVFFQNWLKQQKWFPVLNFEATKLNARLNHWFAIIASGAATLGIHFTFNSERHELLITGLSLATIGAGAWHWLTQYILTKASYTALKGQLNPQQPAPMIEGLMMKAAVPTTTGGKP